MHTARSPLRRATRWLRLAPVLALVALLAGCFEEPVAESLLLEFLPGHALKVALRVDIHEPDSAPAGLKRRLEETRRALLAGDDAWAARFAAAEPAAERFGWEKRLGAISAVTRAALLEPDQGLERFFADTGLQVTLRDDGDRTELRIVPGVPARATARESQTAERALAEWSEAIATYLRATADLYDDLGRHPERARACLGSLLKEDLDDAQSARLPPTTPAEEARVDAVRQALRKVADVLLVADDADTTLDELSRRVYDPFPARIAVRVPGPVLEVEGFTVVGRSGGAGNSTAAANGGTLRIRALGFWDALRALGERWLAPDPLLLHVAHQRAAETPFDLDAVVAAGRRATPATAAEIRAALLATLRPEPAYRVVWSTAGLPDEASDALRKAWSDTPR